MIEQSREVNVDADEDESGEYGKDVSDKLEESNEGEKVRTSATRKRKNYKELYGGYNEWKNNKIDFSYYINMESTIIELLLDNNLESFQNAGKLLFVVLSGLSKRLLYLKRILNLVNLFFYKGGKKFYHSYMHLKILLFIFKNIRLNCMDARLHIFNLLMSNNNLKQLEKYKYIYTPKGPFFTYVDHLYYHIKDFIILIRNLLIQISVEKQYLEVNQSNKSKEELLNELKSNKKIAMYKETDEEMLIHFFKLFNYEYSKSLEKSLKHLIEQCTRVNLPIHSIYLDIYILYNIKNIVKLLVVIDQLICSLYPYYYFYELKLKLLLFHIYNCQPDLILQAPVPQDVAPDPVALRKEQMGSELQKKDTDLQEVALNTSSCAINQSNAIFLIRNVNVFKPEEGSTLLYDESSVGNANYQLNKNDERELKRLLNLRKKEKEKTNEYLNSLYSSDSNKSDNTDLSEHAVQKKYLGDKQLSDEEDDNEKDLYLDEFMNLYINCTEGMVHSLPSLSELHDIHPLKELNEKIRSKRIQRNIKDIDFPILEDAKMNDIKSVDISVMEHEKDLIEGNELENNLSTKANEEIVNDDINTTKKEQKKEKLSNLPNIENIHKNTYNDITYNKNVVVNVAKSLMHSSNYDPIFIKLFYIYLLPIISFEKRIEIFLTYSYSSYKIMKPLIFIIFYNNYKSTHILSLLTQHFRENTYFFQKYKNTYFNGLSLRNIPKSYFIFSFLLSVFFYDHKVESLLYIFKLFSNYDRDIINDQMHDIKYKKIYKNVVLENDEKYMEQKKSINIILIKFVEIYKEKFGTNLCNYFDFYRIFFVLFASCVNME
ncbi:hypothetical protein, conserved [Plasmodium gonderi]|uniref:Uncharacterized protein n=1 Tax=Plasmodium gonderi TaxID=77519 RepID=A0A1Y1JKG8_PLAGO|nr:hypothetical protein, conserved [Plasmodium gonderi]GAW80534.1 hypothetical protein, conserved [Plasmodium gonderi]